MLETLMTDLSNALLKEMKQSGFRKSIIRDAGRKASMPGKKISKTGKVYWETRKNRTDQFNSSL